MFCESLSIDSNPVYGRTMAGEEGLRERKRRKAMRAIQEQAARLIAENGFDTTTIEDIAEAAEVSPSSVYRYFGTKEGVVLYDEYAHPWQEALIGALRDEQPVDAARRAMAEVFEKHFSRDDELPEALVRLVFDEPAVRAAFVRGLDTWVDEIAAIIGAAGSEPGRRLEDRVVARFVVTALWEAVLEWHRGGFSEDLPTLTDRAMGAVG